jgi:hypothetical protein
VRLLSAVCGSSSSDAQPWRRLNNGILDSAVPTSPEEAESLKEILEEAKIISDKAEMPNILRPIEHIISLIFEHGLPPIFSCILMFSIAIAVYTTAYTDTNTECIRPRAYLAHTAAFLGTVSLVSVAPQIHEHMLAAAVPVDTALTAFSWIVVFALVQHEILVHFVSKWKSSGYVTYLKCGFIIMRITMFIALAVSLKTYCSLVVAFISYLLEWTNLYTIHEWMVLDVLKTISNPDWIHDGGKHKHIYLVLNDLVEIHDDFVNTQVGFRATIADHLPLLYLSGSTVVVSYAAIFIAFRDFKY